MWSGTDSSTSRSPSCSSSWMPSGLMDHRYISTIIIRLESNFFMCLQPQPLIALMPDADPDDPEKKRLTCIFLPQHGQLSPSMGKTIPTYTWQSMLLTVYVYLLVFFHREFSRRRLHHFRPALTAIHSQQDRLLWEGGTVRCGL